VSCIEGQSQQRIHLDFSWESIVIALTGENMIKTSAMLMDELKEYVNPISVNT